MLSPCFLLCRMINRKDTFCVGWSAAEWLMAIISEPWCIERVVVYVCDVEDSSCWTIGLERGGCKKEYNRRKYSTGFITFEEDHPICRNVYIYHACMYGVIDHGSTYPHPV